MMNQEQITTKIKTKGFWRVVIRPTVFESKRIPTLSDVRKLIDSSKVSFRDWDSVLLSRSRRYLNLQLG